MSYLGIDMGEKNIGLAIGTMLPEEYNTLHVKPPAKSFFDEQGIHQGLDELISIIRQERISQVVIGLPMREDGQETSQVEKIQAFGCKLEDATNIPVAYVNETLTSFAAEEILKDEGATINEAKQRVDQVAAKLILQQYIEEEM